MKSIVISVILTAALISGLGYFLWMDQQKIKSEEMKPMPSKNRGEDILIIEELKKPAQKKEIDQKIVDNGIYKCTKKGKVTYQNVPCGDEINETDGGMLSIVPAPTQKPQSQTYEEKPRGKIAAIKNSDLEEKNPSRCQTLRDRIKNIDAQARTRSTSRLTEQRKIAKAEMNELRCSETK